MKYPTKNHNICIGRGAGHNFTDESNQLIICTPDFQLQTTITNKEYKIIASVVKRAKQKEITYDST